MIVLVALTPIISASLPDLTSDEESLVLDDLSQILKHKRQGLDFSVGQEVRALARVVYANELRRRMAQSRKALVKIGKRDDDLADLLFRTVAEESNSSTDNNKGLGSLLQQGPRDKRLERRPLSLSAPSEALSRIFRAQRRQHNSNRASSLLAELGKRAL